MFVSNLSQRPGFKFVRIFQVHPAPCAVDRVSEEWFESFATLSLGEVSKRMQSLVMSPTHNLLESKVQLTDICKSLAKMFGKPKELEEIAAMELEHAYGCELFEPKTKTNDGEIS